MTKRGHNEDAVVLWQKKRDGKKLKRTDIWKKKRRGEYEGGSGAHRRPNRLRRGAGVTSALRLVPAVSRLLFYRSHSLSAHLQSSTDIRP